MSNSKPRQIDMCRDTTEVRLHLDTLKSKLSKKQLAEVNKVVAAIKKCIIDALDDDCLEHLIALKKATSLKKLTNKAKKLMSDIPRDIFKR